MMYFDLYFTKLIFKIPFGKKNVLSLQKSKMFVGPMLKMRCVE